VVVYGAAYGISALWYGIVRRADPVTRARTQLPLAWFLFNAYLVGGLLLHGALPTTPKALFFATALMLGLTLPVWAWSRLRGPSALRPATAALLLAWAVPWSAAWAAQWLLAFRAT
ncbi:MAG TPA: hypothetical protein VF282_08425, partial [Bacillota bacterium]